MATLSESEASGPSAESPAESSGAAVGPSYRDFPYRDDVPLPPPRPLPPLFLEHLKFPLYPGHLSLIIGAPGAGKTIVALDLAARAARGTPWPPAPAASRFAELGLPEFAGEPFAPGQVAYLSTESHRPAELAGDFGIDGPSFHTSESPHRLTLIPSRQSLYEKKSFASRPQVPLIEWLDSLPPLRLLVLDPLPPFLGPISSHSSTIRERLMTLLNYAHKRRFPIVATSHVAKMNRTADPLNMALGSLGFTMLARAVLLLTREPGDLNGPEGRRILVPLKNNLAPLDRAYGLTIQTREGEQNPLWPVLPEVKWDEAVIKYQGYAGDGEGRIERLMKTSELALAKEFLQETLKEGPVRSGKMLERARELGLARRTLTRARCELGVRCYNEEGEWIVALLAGKG